MSAALHGPHSVAFWHAELLVTQHPCMLTPQRILKLEYELPPRIAVSPEAHSLLAAMLVAQPEQRISIQQASLRCSCCLVSPGRRGHRHLGLWRRPAVTPMHRSIGVLVYGITQAAGTSLERG